MIEPRSISLPSATERFFTEPTKDNVRYSASFIELTFSAGDGRLRVRGVPVLRKWRLKRKFFAFFLREKQKWVQEWSFNVDNNAFDKIDIVGGYGSNGLDFSKLMNDGLERGLVIPGSFLQEVFEKPAAEVVQVAEKHRVEILHPSPVRRVA